MKDVRGVACEKRWGWDMDSGNGGDRGVRGIEREWAAIKKTTLGPSFSLFFLLL